MVCSIESKKDIAKDSPLLICALFFRIWKAKFSSQIGAFVYPMFAKLARAKTMLARVSESFLPRLPRMPKKAKKFKTSQKSQKSKTDKTA